MVQTALIWTVLSCPILLEKAHNCPMIGFVKKHNNYLYLKVDDIFVHELYPLVADMMNVQKVDYFSDNNSIGAHISIIYPDEKCTFDESDINTQCSFIIKDLYQVILNTKKYIVLTVSSPDLVALRGKYGLFEKPHFKGVPVNFHITITTNFLKDIEN